VVQTSIIIPTYNRAALLPLAIESAKRAGEDVEVIVVDNGSVDDTPQVCRETSGIRHLRLEVNVRQARARNAGIQISEGKYLVFLDDDDQLLPNSLAERVNLLESDARLGFAYGPVLIGDSINCLPTGETNEAQCIEGDLFWPLLESNFILIHSVIARRSLVEAAGLFDPEVVGAEDWLLLMQLSEKHLTGLVNEPVAIYRMFTRKSGQTSSNRIEMCRAAARAQAKGLQLPRALASPAARQAIRQRCLDMLTMSLISEARSDLKHARPLSAAKYMREALRLNPRRAWTLRSLKWLFVSPWEN
jgi:glycosyltransferase involved in cell wall biosynthesis